MLAGPAEETDAARDETAIAETHPPKTYARSDVYPLTDLRATVVNEGQKADLALERTPIQS